LFSFETKLLKL